MQKNEFVDELSGINNELYLKETYKKYINKNPNSHLVIIDMEKFKQINDTYGHNIGDKYLKILANILNISFFDSIVVRLHGDEFAIVTNMDEQQIGKIFELIEQKITLIVDNEQIPVPFRINAGSAYACDNLDCAFEKADLMMYSAKRQGLFYQKFDEKVWNTKIQEKQILLQILIQSAFVFLYLFILFKKINTTDIIYYYILYRSRYSIVLIYITSVLSVSRF